MTHELRPARSPSPAPAVQARRPDPHSTSPVLMDGGPNLSIVTSQAPILTPRDTTRAIIREVAERHGVTVAEVLSPSREGRVMRARHHAILAVRSQKPHLSTPQLGRIFGRDHSTVLHHIWGAASLTQDAAE